MKLTKKMKWVQIACVKCGHGPQNHDDEYRAAARKNESQSRDADLAKFYSPIILTKTLLGLFPSNSP